MERAERFKPKPEPKMKKHDRKHFVCCTPEGNCTGDLHLGLNTNMTLTTNNADIVEVLFPVHSTEEGCNACAQAYYVP